MTQGDDRRCLTEVPVDAPPDVAHDAPPDGATQALTCADPGPFPAGGGTTMGNTVARMILMSASCGGFVMNGRDAVYKVSNTAVGQHILVGITGVKAYVLGPTCSPSPAIPLCLGNAFAAPGNPISVTTTYVGPHFIVVDHEAGGFGAPYTLTVTVN